MEKTRDFYKKIGDTKGTFHAKIEKTKNRGTYTRVTIFFARERQRDEERQKMCVREKERSSNCLSFSKLEVLKSVLDVLYL